MKKIAAFGFNRSTSTPCRYAFQADARGAALNANAVPPPAERSA